VVCFDEQSRQLTKETRHAIPAAPGRPARIDYEYERNGTANLFMLFEPLVGRRRVKVTDRRTAVDFAEVIRELVDSYPTAEKIVLVMDNLNTHKMASLYEAFAPDEARRVIERLEVHYTPKHGSWLNMAETELSVMTKQCLRRRIPDQPKLVREVSAWESSRNTAVSFRQACMNVFSGAGIVGCRSSNLRRTADGDANDSGASYRLGGHPAAFRAMAAGS
jgi:transposase